MDHMGFKKPHFLGIWGDPQVTMASIVFKTVIHDDWMIWVVQLKLSLCIPDDMVLWLVQYNYNHEMKLTVEVITCYKPIKLS